MKGKIIKILSGTYDMYYTYTQSALKQVVNYMFLFFVPFSTISFIHFFIHNSNNSNQIRSQFCIIKTNARIKVTTGRMGRRRT
jgi:Na+/H+ antiporter NhaC